MSIILTKGRVLRTTVACLLLQLIILSFAIPSTIGADPDRDFLIFAGQDKTGIVGQPVHFNDAVIIKPSPLDPTSTYRWYWDFDASLDADQDGDRLNDNDSRGQFSEWTFFDPGRYHVTCTVWNGTIYAMDSLQVTIDYPKPRSTLVTANETYKMGEVINATWWGIRTGPPLAVVDGGEVYLRAYDTEQVLVHEDVEESRFPSVGSEDTITFEFTLGVPGVYRIVVTPTGMNNSARFPELEVYVTVEGIVPSNEEPPSKGAVDPITDDDISPFVPAMTIVLIAALAVAWGTEATKVSMLGLGLPLYSKLRKDRVLDDFTRGRIFGYIGANPGEHFNAIKRALDLPNGTFAHHLNVLEREGHIKSRTDGTYKRYYPVDMRIPNSEGGLKHTQVLILEVVRESPGISQREVAAVLGLSSSTIGYHMKDLVDGGHVKKERRGMGVKYYLMTEPIS